MDDLIAFLKARLGEDEAVAKAAASVAGPDWTWDRESRDGYLRTPDGTIMADALNVEDEEFRPYVARYDPARALREVWAKRAIIEVYEAAAASNDPATDYSIGMATLRMVLRSYAAVWNDHADYRPEWKP